MGGSPSSSTTSSSMPPWASAAGQYMLGNMQGLVSNQLGQGMPGNLNRQTAGFTGAQNKGMSSLMGAAGQGGPLQGLSGSANNLAMNTMNGQYLNPSSNPQLQNYFNAAAQPMAAQYQTSTAPSTMAASQQAGMMNSNAGADARLMNQYSLGNNLQSLAANIYEPAYQFERGQQTNMASMLPSLQQGSLLPGQTQFGVGAVQQQQQQQGMNTNIQNALSQFQFPYQLLSQLGGSIGPATGGASNVTSTSPGPTGK